MIHGSVYEFLSAHFVWLQQVAEGLNDTAENFLASIEKDESEIAPSSIYAAAAILEGVPFINGSPQNTFVPGLIELAVQKGVRAPQDRSDIRAHCNV